MIEHLYDLLKVSHATQKENLVYSYVVFDGVKHPTLWNKLSKSSLMYSTLFKEKKLQNELKEVAPYLVKLDFSKEKSLLESKNILKYYEKEEMMFINSFLSFKEQLAQLQEIFYVVDSEKKVEAYFRFYDSLIFETLLEMSKKDFLEKLFFATKSILYKNSTNTDSVVQCTFNENTLHTKLIDLKKKREK